MHYIWLRIQYITIWMCKLTKLFETNHSHQLLIDIFITGLCEHHSSISLNLFEAMHQFLPSENNEQKQQENEEINEPINILQIPKELKIYMFNFNSEQHLYHKKVVDVFVLQEEIQILYIILHI